MKGSPEGGAHRGGGPGGVDLALGTWSAESSRDPGVTALLRGALALTSPRGTAAGAQWAQPSHPRVVCPLEHAAS